MDMDMNFSQQIEIKKKRETTILKYAAGVIPHPWKDNKELLFNIGLEMSKLGLPPKEVEDVFVILCRKTDLSYKNTAKWRKCFVDGYWSDPFWHDVSVAR